LEVWGDVVEATDFSQFPEDLRSVCALPGPGYTLLADYAGIGVFALPEIWERAQAFVFESGVKKVAVFWGAGILGRWATEQSAQGASPEYAALRRSFKAREEAEAWLDE
ncbi:hypothetical protein ACFL2Q_12670, partial [Thermodesulfobacteriota bacterium]